MNIGRQKVRKKKKQVILLALLYDNRVGRGGEADFVAFFGSVKKRGETIPAGSSWWNRCNAGKQAGDRASSHQPA